MKKWVIFYVCISCCWACEKTIQIAPVTQTPKIVVEAKIENGQPPIVLLSRSLNYFATADAATLTNAYVHNAKLTLNNGTADFILKEYSVTMSNGYKIYYYSSEQLTPQNTVYGEPGKKYQLLIETDGAIYQSSTSIPLLTKKIDSIWWKKAPENVDSTKVLVMTKITDPPGLGNYIRYFTSVNLGNLLPGLTSVFNDQIIDGKTYEVQIQKGVSKNEKIDLTESAFFSKGDTVIIKFCNIDKSSYDFWRTWEFTYQSVGNPFSAPGKVIGNISNGGLGSFCGYAVQYKQLIIPK